MGAGYLVVECAQLDRHYQGLPDAASAADPPSHQSNAARIRLIVTMATTTSDAATPISIMQI